MAAGLTHPLVRFIRRISASGGGGDTSDGELLKRFVSWRDDAAFTALVCRHGPMVFGVCARVLGASADAEDAFQATFLVLVRRAGSVARPELLGNWLYGVAYRTALKARANAVKRRRHESQIVGRAMPDVTDGVVWRELQPVLDDELSRLPQKYRLPLVLCHLEGLTHEEIARRLGCPRETVTTRLSRARRRLCEQMTRRGLALSAGAVVAGLTRDALARAVPQPLLEDTIRITSSVALGSAAGAVSLQVAALTEGVLQAMLLTRFKIAVAVVLAMAVVTVGVGAFALNTSTAAQTAPVKEGVKASTPVADRAEPEAKADQGASVKEMPPVVVQTVPRSGDTKVDADAVKEIRVTFSKDMEDQSWSWSQISDETFPKTTGKPHYEKDRRTCILPVKVEPGKTYVLWLNSAKFGNFKDGDGRSAVPYLLVFETKP
jgi:RNA polymerase sigma factor (sigma-70 family)